MFIFFLVVIVLAVVFISLIFGTPGTQPAPRTRNAREAQRKIVEMTSGDLESAKGKFRDAVREHMPDLVKNRNKGIFIEKSGIPNGSEWNSHCQHFLDKVILPRLTMQESMSAMAAGLSGLATELIENAVKAETLRLERAGQVFPEIRNYSGSDSYRTDVPAITKPSGAKLPKAPTSSPRQGGSGRISRGLIIRPEPIEKILSGTKTWEMRSRPVEIRGTIALVKKGTKAVYGVADIVDCRGPLTHSERMANEHRHGITPDRWADPDVAKYHYAWVLDNVRRLKYPVPYEHKGGVQFVTLDDGVAAQIEYAL